MSLDGIVRRARRRTVNVRMSERIVIDRPTGTVIDDEGRGQTTYELIYDGVGRLHDFRPHEQTPDVSGSTASVQRIEWHIPAVEVMPDLLASGKVATWNGPVQTGDRARRMTAGKPVKTVRIAGEHDVTDKTAQRLGADDITGGVWA